MGSQIVALLRDGDNLTLSLNVDRKAGDVSLDLTLKGKEDTKLAGTILELAKAKSVVAGIIVLFSPLWGAVVLFVIAGIALIVLGIIQIVRAFTFGRGAGGAAATA